ncbi:MAG: hypothetical protein WBV69_03755 [Candidatus Sulfotelmatobacter sp.]
MAYEAIFKNVKVEYNIAVEHPRGYEASQCRDQLGIGVLLCPTTSKKDPDDPFEKPKGRIKMSAWGTVEGNVSSQLTLGFVQTLVTTERHVIYHPSAGRQFPFTYQQKQPKLPIKDRMGKPWYKEGPKNIKTFNVNEVGPFKISVVDEPHMSFPVIPNKDKTVRPNTFELKDNFMACFTAKYAADLFFLFQIDWNVEVVGRVVSVDALGKAQVTFTPHNQHGTPSGINVSKQNPLPPPYSKPHEIDVVSDKPANLALLTTFM